MSQIAVKLDNETLASLDASAKFRSLSREEMLRQPILDAADYDRYYRESVDAGLKDIEADRIISNEERKKEMAVLFQEMTIRNKRQ